MKEVLPKGGEHSPGERNVAAVVGEIDCPARALKALGLLLAVGDLTVG